MGGGGPTNSTVTQSNLPEYARPYYESLMKRADVESNSDYIPYKWDRTADMSNATQSGLSSAMQYGRSGTGIGGVLNQLQAINKNVGQTANYNPSNFQSKNINYGSSGLDRVNTNNVNFGSAGLDRVKTENFGRDDLNQYMSPYMDAVVNRAQGNTVDQFRQQQAQRNLQAAQAGSFGGSRAAVQNAIAGNALSNNLADIYVQGQQSAYENAQNQFNTDAQRQLQAQMQNQNTALGFNQGNQQARLSADQGNQSTALQFNLANQQNRLNAAQLREQSRQFGRQSALDAYGLQGQLQQQRLGALDQQDAAMRDRIQSMLGVGQTREDYQQRDMDQRYADFVNQRDAERQNLQFLSSLLQGVPISPNREIMQTSTGNNLAGILGSLGGISSLNGMQQS